MVHIVGKYYSSAKEIPKLRRGRRLKEKVGSKQGKNLDKQVGEGRHSQHA